MGYFSKNIKKNENISQDETNKSINNENIITKGVDQLNIEKDVKNLSTHFESYNEIDPTYALPKYLVDKLGLFKQIIEKV